MSRSDETKSELWFRPHPWTSLAELRALIQNRRLTATPRLGRRDGSHSKGYAVGQPADLKLFDLNTDREPLLTAPVTITDLLIKRLAKFTTADLRGCGPAMQSWLDVHKVLGFFEQGRRELNRREWVTIVRFDYRTEEML